MNDDPKMTFEFRHSDDTSVTTMAFEVSEAEQWSEIARRFRDFLSSVYGYRVGNDG
jgi:hypothetical protein